MASVFSLPAEGPEINFVPSTPRREDVAEMGDGALPGMVSIRDPEPLPTPRGVSRDRVFSMAAVPAAATPDPRQVALEQITAQIRQLIIHNGGLERRNAALQHRIAELQDRVRVLQEENTALRSRCCVIL